MKRKVSDELQIDVLMMYQDAIDIIHDWDTEEVVFSEQTPGFMKSAAKKGLVRLDPEADTPFGIGRTKQLSRGEQIPLDTIKRIRYVAKSCVPHIERQMDLDSPMAKTMMMWGIPVSLSGAKRVIKWADQAIAKSKEAACKE